MADLSTSYMGIKLASPIVLGASTFSNRVEKIKEAEAAGAGAVVIYSLFQEQIELDTMELDEELGIGAERFAESLTYFPHLEHAGPREHVMWVEKTRKEVKIPIFGSLNAISTGNWTDYAKHLEGAGCDGLELNLYAVETDPDRTAQQIEAHALEVVGAVKSAVSIPVAVKLSPFYTSVASFAKRAVDAGADGLVLFNRFYQPWIDVDQEALKIKLDLSASEEGRLPARWIAILSGHIDADLAASTGVHTGRDAVRMILAGAAATQVVSAIYRQGLGHISVINREISEWMDAKGYGRIDEFRGKVSKEETTDPYAFERAQYIRALLGH